MKEFSKKTRLLIGLVAIAIVCIVGFATGSLDVDALGMLLGTAALGATVVDDAVREALNADIAVGVRYGTMGHQHALERLRSNFDQDGRAIGAAIATGMVQADLPGAALNSKLAYDTPRSSQDTVTAPK